MVDGEGLRGEGSRRMKKEEEEEKKGYWMN